MRLSSPSPLEREPQGLTRLLAFALMSASATLLLTCGNVNTTPSLTGPVGIVNPDGGSASAKDAGMPSGLSIAQACQTLIEARCDALTRCGALGFDLQSKQLCQKRFADTWCGPSTWPAKVAAQTLKYDGAAAASCAQAFAQVQCSEVFDEPRACGIFLRPAVLLGQPCYPGSLNECLEGVCRGASCPQQCQLKGKFGETCASSADCEAGFSCEKIDQIGDIGQCRPYAAAKEPCSRASCRAGLLCIGGLCEAPPVIGAPCFAGKCGEQAFCQSAADSGVCAALGDVNARCAKSDECRDGLVCAAGQCSSAIAGLGEGCRAPQQCLPPFVCRQSGNVNAPRCEVASALSEPCSLDADCEDPLQCDVTGTCQKRRAVAASCTSSTQCDALATCTQGVCQPLGLVGAKCSSKTQCLSLVCRADGKQAVCQPLGTAQAVCEEDGECESGRCAQGTCAAICKP